MRIAEKGKLAITGVLIGAAAVVLTLLGNPGNMGFCIACFLRDTAGAMHLHTAPIVEYVRPEIIGIILGSFALSVLRGDFRPRGGSSPMIRFIIGFIVMLGALVFLGCPLRMVIRLGGGDLNALVGLLGFVAGIGAGCFFLNNGFSLGRAEKQTGLEGVTMPFLTIVLFVLFLAVPSVFLISESGPGSMHAPVAAALLAGLIAGAAAERTRLCMAGGIRDIFLIKDFTLITGFVFIFIAALISNIAVGNFHLGFADQPVAHDKHIWNFLSMVLVGLSAAMLGGCPLRQLILAGEGNSDSAVTVLGMLIGAAFSHNAGAASSAGTGPAMMGKVSVVAGLVFCLALAAVITRKRSRQ